MISQITLPSPTLITLISLNYDGTILIVSDSSKAYIISYVYSIVNNQYILDNNSSLPTTTANCFTIFPDGLYTIYGESFSAGAMSIRILDNSNIHRTQIAYYTYTTNYTTGYIYRISVS